MNKLKSIICASLVAVLCSGCAPVQNIGEPSLTPVSESTPPPAPAGWLTYGHETDKYFISYPGDFVINDVTDHQVILPKKVEQPGAGPGNYVYVKVMAYDIEKKQGFADVSETAKIEKLLGADVGEKVNLTENTEQKDWFEYIRLEDESINGMQAIVFKNSKVWEMPEGTEEYQYIINKGPQTYLVGGYVGSKKAESFRISTDEMKKILATITFTNSNPDEVLAGQTTEAFYMGYLNCMQHPPAEAEGRVSQYCQENNGLRSDEFVKNLDHGGTAKASADGITCSQSRFDDFDLEKSNVENDQAVVTVKERFGPKNIFITVYLKKVNSSWRVDNIICPK